jgi:O-antigen/teichoic acid export membrane protein
VSVRRSVIWAFSGQFIAFAVGFTGSVIVARLLSPAEMGVYAIAMAVLGIIQIVSAFGVGSYIVREASLTPDVLDSAFTLNGLLAVVLSLVMVAASYGGSFLFGDAGAARVLRLLALGPLIGAFAFRPQTMMQRDMQFKTVALVNVGAILVNNVVTVAAAALGASYMSLAYASVAQALVTAVAYNLAAPHHVGFRTSTARWRAMTSFGLQIMSISGISMLLNRVQDFTLGRLLGLPALGLYVRASNTSNMIFDNLYGTATRVVFSQLAKDFRETGELSRPFLRAFQLITGVMWPFQLGLAVLAKPAIHLLFGARWLPAALPLSLLMVAQALTLCFGMNWELFVLRDETRRQTRLEITRSIISLAFFVVGCRFGLAGAATGAIAGSLFGWVVYFPHMNRLAEIAPGQLSRIYGAGVLLTLSAVTPSLILMVFTHWSPSTPIPWVAGSVGLGGLCWLGALVKLRHPLFEELRAIVRKAPIARLV